LNLQQREGLPMVSWQDGRYSSVAMLFHKCASTQGTAITSRSVEWPE